MCVPGGSRGVVGVGVCAEIDGEIAFWAFKKPPGVLQDALGCLPGAPGSSGRAPGAILGRFWVPRGASRVAPGRFFIASPLSHADKSAEPAVRLINNLG